MYEERADAADAPRISGLLFFEEFAKIFNLSLVLAEFFSVYFIIEEYGLRIICELHKEIYL